MMLAFFLSFQQSLFTLVFMACHTSLLIGFPFKKTLHQKIMRGIGGIWLIAGVQVSLVATLVTTLNMPVASSDQFCQSPSTLDSPLSPFLLTLAIIYGICMLVFVVATCTIVILIQRSLRTNSAMQAKSHFKLRVMRNSVIVAVINIISLGTALVVDGLRGSGLEIDNKVLVSLSITLMALGKVSNPWVHSLRLMISKIANKK
jgi:hypothetical protein